MYIEDRLFSETSDEILYSVTMTEEEYDLYSEFLEEKAFNRAAYKGLTLAQKEALKSSRRLQASNLLKWRSNLQNQHKAEKEAINNVRNAISVHGDWWASSSLTNQKEKDLLRKAKDSIYGTNSYLRMAGEQADKNLARGYQEALGHSKEKADLLRRRVLGEQPAYDSYKYISKWMG
jgi:hypothetical protein